MSNLINFFKSKFNELSKNDNNKKSKKSNKDKNKKHLKNQVSLFDLSFDKVDNTKADKESKPNIDSNIKKFSKTTPDKLFQNNFLKQIANLSSKINEKKSDISDFFLSRENLSNNNSERYQNNLDAVNILNRLNDSKKDVTTKEQSILAKYVGWGGLSKKFTENSKSDKELKNILGNYYDSAKASCLTSFYTPATVIKFIYKVLDRFGFEKGRILEPACGTGRFLGFMPEDMYYNSKILGIEMDKLSSDIAKYLYPSSKIINTKYEDSKIKNESVDLCITNVPFSTIHPYDTEDKHLNKYNLNIHDYYFIKSIEKVRDMGLIIFITSSGTLDKADTSVRRIIDKKCDFIGAVRLPIEVFCDTNTTTDIIFLRKNNNKLHSEDWVDIVNYEDFLINSYYKNNPHMMLGEMKIVSSQYGPKQILKNAKSLSISDYDKLLKYFPSDIYETPLNDAYMYEEDELKLCTDVDDELKEGEFILENELIYQKQGKYLIPSSLIGKRKEKLKQFVIIKDTIKNIIQAQLNNCTDNELNDLQRNLNTEYDKYVAEYGFISSRGNKKLLSQDTLYYLVASLEIYNKQNDTYKKADMFSKRTIGKSKSEKKPEKIEDAIMIAFNNYGYLNIDYICSLMNQSYHSVKDELLSKQLAYIDPLTGYLVDRDSYLSGYVKEKLKIAKEASVNDNAFLVNVKALEANQPKYETDVFFNISSTWIPSNIKSDFIEKTLDLRKNSIQLLYSTHLGYSINCSAYIPINKNEFIWGTKRRKSLSIVEAALNMKTITVTDKETQNGKEVSVKNLEETQLAMNILDKWLIAFHSYVTSNSYIHKELLDIYNEKFIDYKEKEYKNILNDVRINPNIKLREHQLKGASRIVTSDCNTLLCHSVGSGKTYTMITAAQELNRISKIDSKKGNKNLFVIPNSLCESGQFAKEYFNLYPQANILATTSKDFSKANRRKIIAKIVTCNWDSIIIPHSVLGLIPLEAETELKLVESDLKELNKTLKYYRDECPNFSIKKLETIKENYLNRIKELNDMHKDDALLSFEKLGITNLFIDEAHNFKNLYFNTTMQVSGISSLKTKKTQDLYNKLRYFKSVNGNKGVTFATATPISNSICEMYTLLTYLNKPSLEHYRVDTFDAWASTFGSIISSMEVDPTGQGFRFQQRFAKFCNVPELVNIFRQVADVVNICDIEDLDIPKVKEGKPIVEIIKPTSQMKEYIDSLVKRAEGIHNSPYDPRIDNMLNVTTDGRLMAVSPALVGIDGISPKIIKVGENIASLYHEDKISTHLVFCDLGTPTGNSHNVYNDIKNELLKNNVLEKDIAYIHDANTPEKRKKLIDDFNNGVIRILIGSTSKMGEGTNFQKHLKSLHHVDVPWKPSSISQREGRILRQGNLNKEVYIFRYVVEGSFDAYSWQTIEIKAKYIAQILNNSSSSRTAEDIGNQLMSYAETKACACSDDRILKLCEINREIQIIELNKKAFLNQNLLTLQDIKSIENSIEALNISISKLEEDIKVYASNSNDFKITLDGKTYFDNKTAIETLGKIMDGGKVGFLGEIYGLNIVYEKEFTFDNKVREFISLGNNYKFEFSALKTPKTLIKYFMDYNKISSDKLDSLKEKYSFKTNELLSLKEVLKNKFTEDDKLESLKLSKVNLENELRLGNTVIKKNNLDHNTVEKESELITSLNDNTSIKDKAESNYLFTGRRVLTKGVNYEIPIQLQIFMWNLIDNLKIKRDYLQVFDITPIDSNSMLITHKQEIPKYTSTYKIEQSTDVNLKINTKITIFVIDNIDYVTMLLSSEY
ncbi:TPA: hypothetical protein KON86_002736 [Clostridioides difficile]|nr:DUF960 family protein [Clostridioides difficile]HBF4443106.1 hypothetical protein [Clostridioides difficile]HBG1420639.1 hypothetical protein [Clostridioides difficile]